MFLYFWNDDWLILSNGNMKLEIWCLLCFEGESKNGKNNVVYCFDNFAEDSLLMRIWVLS